jgi:hypothetical protein
MVYLAARATVSVRLNKIAAAKVNALWLDPRTGQSLSAGRHSNAGVQSFASPSEWEDAVLILEAASD